MKTGFSLWEKCHRENPVFITGIPAMRIGFPVMKTGFFLWEKLHRENPVFITGMGLQCSYLGQCYEHGHMKAKSLILCGPNSNPYARWINKVLALNWVSILLGKTTKSLLIQEKVFVCGCGCGCRL